ncbi:hypothetical protein PG_0994 [Porphyromonas gingivalis W83]|uniref:Uncharacterized protein n=1 Tax=Porphyromonas gingivalis (strain ATCC BAA-308 / W83) TaxID=242619 RepID=Q7MVQ4_PORGI|nr:hypothetical protein PG_0994 [Porphyromonas gingivalis W83]
MAELLIFAADQALLEDRICSSAQYKYINKLLN